MATSIKETPILYGKDARRFEKEVKENEKRAVPKKDYDRALKSYEALVKACGGKDPFQ